VLLGELLWAAAAAESAPRSVPARGVDGGEAEDVEAPAAAQGVGGGEAPEAAGGVGGGEAPAAAGGLTAAKLTPAAGGVGGGEGQGVWAHGAWERVVVGGEPVSAGACAG
jgi:hypothetical protein